jgi:hypothetical protein
MFFVQAGKPSRRTASGRTEMGVLHATFHCLAAHARTTTHAIFNCEQHAGLLASWQQEHSVSAARWPGPAAGPFSSCCSGPHGHTNRVLALYAVSIVR